MGEKKFFGYQIIKYLINVSLEEIYFKLFMNIVLFLIKEVIILKGQEKNVNFYFFDY